MSINYRLLLNIQALLGSATQQSIIKVLADRLSQISCPR